MLENNRSSPGSVLSFGVFQVNPAARELRKHGVRIRLPGQAFCILSMLLEKPGEVVTRQELRERLWASDTFVDFEHGLNSAIKKLRNALGDSPRNAKYIETLPRVGYRFVAPVAGLSAVPLPMEGAPILAAQDSFGAPAIRKPWAFRRWHILFGISVALAGLVAAFPWSHLRSRPQPAGGRLMLAVLPFENLTGDPGQDYFSDGLTEEMLSQLGRLDPQRLGVIGLRTSGMHYQRTPQELNQIVHELGVQYVLGGSVRRDSNQLRVAARLVQVKDQTNLFVREYNREVGSVLSVQDEIAREVADETQLVLSADRKPLVSAAMRQSPLSPRAYEAYDLYLKGRYFWNKRTPAGFAQAAESFQQAIVKDPTYARPYAGLADTYALMSSYYIAPQQEMIPKARAAALKALELDDELAEAHVSLALITELYDWDWQTSEKEYRRAMQLDPSYATAHQWYAESLGFQGRFEEALAESERARQLDPLSLIIAADNCAILYYSRRFDSAIEKCRAVQAMEPAFSSRAVAMIAASLVEQKRYDEAMRVAQLVNTTNESWTWSWQTYVYGRSGQAAKARRALRNFESAARHATNVPLPVVETAYIGAGDNDRAVELLEKACTQRSNALIEIKVSPVYDPLRANPRFQALLRRVGLAQ